MPVENSKNGDLMFITNLLINDCGLDDVIPVD